MTTGEKIRAARKSKGMTLTELADAIGVTASAVSQYERGKLIPNRFTLIKMVMALECMWEDIVSDEDCEHEGIQVVQNEEQASVAPANVEEFRSLVMASHARMVDLLHSFAVPGTFLTSTVGAITENGFDILSKENDFNCGPFWIIGKEAAALLALYTQLNTEGRMRLIENAYDLLEIPKYNTRNNDGGIRDSCNT